jgi:hypothetical protein
MASKKPDAVTDAELRRLYVDEGLSMGAIGARVGLSAPSVLLRLRRAGIPTRPKRSVLTRDGLAAHIAAGRHLAEIARLEGLTGRAVANQLRRHGLQAPDGHGRRVYPRHERVNFAGYWMLHRPDHPAADKRGRVMEHRIVMEEKIGRYLRREEVVHHMNHVKDDNRPENLMLMPDASAHLREHYPKGAPVANGNEARWGKR